MVCLICTTNFKHGLTPHLILDLALIHSCLSGCRKLDRKCFPSILWSCALRGILNFQSKAILKFAVQVPWDNLIVYPKLKEEEFFKSPCFIGEPTWALSIFIVQTERAFSDTQDILGLLQGHPEIIRVRFCMGVLTLGDDPQSFWDVIQCSRNFLPCFLSWRFLASTLQCTHLHWHLYIALRSGVSVCSYDQNIASFVGISLMLLCYCIPFLLFTHYHSDLILVTRSERKGHSDVGVILYGPIP
jgi:hypothetical protein